ncbi:fructose-1-6-bisphosphatase [Sodiomyces alkalinus F11]|uniref:Fructose-1-6-bisphosphatase n=1 Tax=Sodiomyces alkalinus (strain CBS 110278 / VKM F-3762 / F11) TaxID=1314773 RepID=A0A3N2PZI4_SODAK|nr:fructose-1-6-bisphosphatase [Sodiomyces alkalinus F11]ROT39930.1 fructose-1-6-bisphosphatase [Sodiomyces alkalinus F11]
MVVPNGSPYAALEHHLKSLLPQDSKRSSLVSSVLPTLIDAIAAVSSTLQSSHHVALVGTANAFGDDQLNIDVSAENIIREALARCPAIAVASSEEDPIERPNATHKATAEPTQSAEGSSPSSAEQYTVAFDPLDGSSIIAPNWSVGTIVGIWDGTTALNQDPATKQIAAVLGVYGPRTTAIIALRIPGLPPACFEVGIDPSGSVHQIIRSGICLADPPFKTRYFAPANLRSAAEDDRYLRLVQRLIVEKCTLRYCGGLVPDLVHALVQGHGLYVSPVTGSTRAKLRRLYELCPVALVMECVGGKAVDPASGNGILERAVADCDERGGLVCGNREEVEAAIESLLG